ncbi:MAG TPA: UDP-N-acetylmuramoyl-L-alanyl-D-glutamate--2,6-diaminopimelate ligase [Candidatus Pacearchaeota archaeon]|nr:UDP-N-acetylmuramoyl-L-alanyl-D-glutamate--2,6-diaminopimelate ligase [Candidatus Pacearchaeota archaeon]HOK94404.1 UDP-N-acetylmuramoyl-L-alanyl-D-glutamate--2,6-diaminopimelate ligase [Candidatus Pacearchaeota archaeon]HPO75477.1 UDP-N-acetylmuramoyl-L-alanyl-D-glutamate--2,6-diaminopimelate ligase [Candidatus Pacearchaeota archaeon]
MINIIEAIKNFYHFLWSFFSALFYGFPSRHLKVIGVTGTKGKSTTVEMISKILEENGQKVASLSSIEFKINKTSEKNLFKMTMPGRGYVQKFLRKAVRAHCQYAIIEVTSEGILQYRHKFINFEAAVFTNLAPEHIERHGSFENYRKAKGKLFEATKRIHILNLDDPNVDYFLNIPAERKIGFTLKESKKSVDTLVKGENLEIKDWESKFFVEGIEFNLHLPGIFNTYNALCAIATALSQSVPLSTSKKALEKIKGVPGRMELVIREPFKVIVDYAHTPQSLAEVYETLRKQKTKSKIQNTKLICVLGSCGGGRDKWKRPKLGEIAAKYCDEIIITNEDPYDEDPSQILSMIKSGISNSQFPMTNFYEILDRREAINKALKLAKSGDTVIITGKGCEPWMCIENGKKISWDDRKIVKEEFEKIKVN